MFSENILKEELKNSIFNLRRLKDELNKKYSWGYSIKNISGKKYLYKMKRVKGKVVYKYIGKISAEEIEKINLEKKEKKALKIKIKSLSEEIKFINRSLKRNGK
jgi:ribonuclease HII